MKCTGAYGNGRTVYNYVYLDKCLHHRPGARPRRSDERRDAPAAAALEVGPLRCARAVALHHRSPTRYQVALPRCTTSHPLSTRFTGAFGASILGDDNATEASYRAQQRARAIGEARGLVALGEAAGPAPSGPAWTVRRPWRFP